MQTEIKYNKTREDFLSQSEFYLDEIKMIEARNIKGEELSESTKKGMITTNLKLIIEARINQIHFNIPKLESVIGYDQNDKDSMGIWKTISNIEEFGESLFPQKLI